ncbi:MAG: transposase [Chloroflexota bacterium]|nr:transposase [Chloroflexota bacterium]
MRPRPGRTPADARRGDRGQPIGQDHGKRKPRGYDAGKKVSGRKRHLLVVTVGLVLKARVHPAEETDATGARPVLTGLDRVVPRMELVWVDGGTNGFSRSGSRRS